MTEEPYRWLEAVSNRREYVREQLKGGSPVFAVSLPDGILLLGVGTGHSKVFELFDRQALAALGHPADIEKIRQAAIDAAHVEGFTRAPEDVTLRRLVGFGLSPQLKTAFEQIYSAPFLAEIVMAELGSAPDKDMLVRLHFDGSYQLQSGGILMAVGQPETETACRAWLEKQLAGKSSRMEVADVLLQAWWCVTNGKAFDDKLPVESERQAGWKATLNGKQVELGWLRRNTARHIHYEAPTLETLPAT